MVKLVIGEEALVIEVVDKVIVIEIEEYTATPREIMSIAPITLANRI